MAGQVPAFTLVSHEYAEGQGQRVKKTEWERERRYERERNQIKSPDFKAKKY